MRNYVYMVVVVLATSIPATVYAGAWTQSAGKGQMIVNGLYYTTDKLYNNTGNKASQARYSKYELNPYFEYGLTDSITAGANLFFLRADQATQDNWGVGDSEFFLRARLFQSAGFMLSVEPMVKLPSPEGSNETPQLGSRKPDAGVGLSAGYGFSAWGQNHFANIDTGYRYRFGDPEDQIKLSGTLGIGVNDRWMIMPQAFATLRTIKPAIASFTQSSGDDYNLVKLQISTIYKVSDETSLQFGVFSHVGGNNVGAGDGIILSLWKKI